MNNLIGKTILITGASSGIGEAIAELLAEQIRETGQTMPKEKTRILLNARSTDKLQEIARRLQDKEKGIYIHCFAFDVSDRSQCEANIARILQEFQHIDVLINNAGLSRGLEPLWEASIEDWEEMINTNLKGLLYVTRDIVGSMVARNSGHVVNIGSTAGHATYPGGHVYTATKHGVVALSRALRKDCQGTNVRVSCVDPGKVDTNFSVVRFHGDVDKAQKVYEGMRPLTGRDVAETVLFCLQRPLHVSIDTIVCTAVDQTLPL